MMIEINLLPKIERKSNNNLVVLLSAVVLVIAQGGVLFYLYNDLQTQRTSLQAESDLVSIKLEKIASGDTFKTHQEQSDKLKQAISYFESQPPYAVKVIEEFTKLLPTRGYIMSFNYTTHNTVSANIQFDTYRDAAYLLKRLEQTEWVNGVLFNTVNAQSPVQEQSQDATGNTIVTQDENQMPRFTAQYTIYLKPSAWLAKKGAEN
ncbi:MAG: hypothetical protein ACRCWQ_15180 [Bacilli bacterium]